MGAAKSKPAINKDVLFNLPKVELHLHLDGSIRFSTLFELAQLKHISFKNAKTIDEMKKVICTHNPTSLTNVLAAFDLFLPCIIGDADAIERVAYELCEDQAKQNVVYFEARYSPYLLSNQTEHYKISQENIFIDKGLVSPTEVVKAVNQGIRRGQNDFGVIARTILCCIESFEKYSDGLLDLAVQFKDDGVVGIDVAGCSSKAGEHYDESIIQLFQKAEKIGINRTAHAGESNGAKTVVQAIEDMKVTRIGHGYRIMEDQSVYDKYAIPSSPDAKIHFEACPYSSVMTSAVKPDWTVHPLKRWVDDNVNCSISRDDPTCFENTMPSELHLVAEKIGLTLEQIKLCQLNAAQSSFLEDDAKEALIKHLKIEFDKIN